MSTFFTLRQIIGIYTKNLCLRRFARRRRGGTSQINDSESYRIRGAVQRSKYRKKHLLGLHSSPVPFRTIHHVAKKVWILILQYTAQS